jgi:phosphatidylglycerophosphate synthase
VSAPAGGTRRPSTLNRTLAVLVVPLLARTPVTPNQVTLAALVVGLVAAWAFAKGPTHAVEGALWLELSYVLDNCDGELARRQARMSGLGSWLDTVADLIVNAALFLSLGVGLSQAGGSPWWLTLGIAAAVGVVFSYVASFAVQVQRRGAEAWRHPDPPRDDATDGRIVGFRKRAREDFSWIVLAAAFAGHMGWLVVCGLAGGLAVGVTGLRTIVRERAAPPMPGNLGGRRSSP